jgi:UDP-3-O-[3-hydroxymyristoyl] N-acetylglucosamine deacetylase
MFSRKSSGFAKPLSEVFLPGLDLESGQPAEARLSLDFGLNQPCLFWPGAPQGLLANALANLFRESNRCTRLWTTVGPQADGEPLTLTEHLLAALLFHPHLPVRISVPTGSLPLLDGSALPWREALAEFAPPESPHQYPSQLSLDLSWPGGYLRAEPASAFSATYEIERHGYHSRYHLEAAESAYAQVLPARTFIFQSDFDALRSEGRLRGADADSGLLLGEDPPRLLHPDQYRMPEEPARHKMLDLLGDLALFGLALPRLRLHLRNAGHAQHHRLLESLIHERDANHP